MIKSAQASIRYLKGVGPKRVKLFEKLGVEKVEDLLYYFPRRYEDRSNFVSISSLIAGQTQSILATVLESSIRRSPRRKIFIVELTAQDSTGKIKCLWFNQPYLRKFFPAGTRVIFFGKPEIYNGRLQLNSPEYEILDEEEGEAAANESLNIGRIVPIYGLTEGLNQRYLRKTVKASLEEFIPALADVLPFDIRRRLKLLNLAQSLNQVHFPENPVIQQEALRRLSFEEFFIYQLPVILRKITAKQKKGIAHKIDQQFLEEILGSLAFKLTSAQQMVLNEIIKDMAGPQPMQRLLQGDVGCGKTIVAFLASLIAIKSGSQAAFMVPTEILASQHFKNFSRLIKNALCLKQFKIGLLTGSLKEKARENIYRKIKQGKINLVIGTHSLIEESLEFKNLGLVVIDEQHKFGVSQRRLLPKKGQNPDCLIMTATPIPRTLSLTLYGDLDVSLINEFPAGRGKVITRQFTERERQKAYGFIKAEIKMGRQAYIVYPLIEESDLSQLKAAKKMYEELKKKEFKEFRLGLVHGRMKKADTEAVMQSFAGGKIDILVATTILEVGIDVANATCMVIEHAEHFGLSQLHQLRGRIGRASFESYCLLITEPKTTEASGRIKAILESNDGFKIAEEDLRIRGPGEFFGKRQHGLSELKIANPVTQMHLLKLAREEVKRLLAADPGLQLRQNLGLRELLKERFGSYEELLEGG